MHLAALLRQVLRIWCTSWSGAQNPESPSAGARGGIDARESLGERKSGAPFLSGKSLNLLCRSGTQAKKEESKQMMPREPQMDGYD